MAPFGEVDVAAGHVGVVAGGDALGELGEALEREEGVGGEGVLDGVGEEIEVALEEGGGSQWRMGACVSSAVAGMARSSGDVSAMVGWA